LVFDVDFLLNEAHNCDMGKVKRSAKMFWALRMEPELLFRIRIKAKSKGKMAAWVRARLWEAVNK
jgi:hypothetical protein